MTAADRVVIGSLWCGLIVVLASALSGCGSVQYQPGDVARRLHQARELQAQMCQDVGATLDVAIEAAEQVEPGAEPAGDVADAP